MSLRFPALDWPRQGFVLLEAVLAALLAVQAVHLFWALVVPVGSFGAPAPPPQRSADFTILSRFDPFFRGLPDGGAATGGNGGFVLYGVRSTADGKGAAILGSGDGRQEAFTVGQAVAPGVTLAEVGSEHVILVRGGMRTRVAFQSTAATAAPPPVKGAATAAAVAPKDFLAQNSVEPLIQDGQVRGYALSARDNGQSLQAAGLQHGDVIRAINGALPEGRAEDIAARLAGAGQVELTIERGGQTITRQIRISQ